MPCSPWRSLHTALHVPRHPRRRADCMARGADQEEGRRARARFARGRLPLGRQDSDWRGKGGAERGGGGMSNKNALRGRARGGLPMRHVSFVRERGSGRGLVVCGHCHWAGRPRLSVISSGFVSAPCLPVWRRQGRRGTPRRPPARASALWPGPPCP
eukprot:3072428-Prymnesium_polylepis.1